MTRRSGRRPALAGFLPSEDAVSEIVGALLLVLVVSSAAFGFGVFMHQQAKATELQKAAEQERQLESLAIQSLVPVDAFQDDCSAGSDGRWDSVSIVVTSLHLHESRIPSLRLNGYAVRDAYVGGTHYDFTVAGTEITVLARQTVTIVLRNIDDACPLSDPYSLYGTQSAQGIPTSDSLLVHLDTALTNSVERAFVPPTAVASLEAATGLVATYSLVGTASQPGGEGAFLVKWQWDYWDTACGTGANHMGPFSGHRIQRTFTQGQAYCARLTVLDNNQFAATTEVAFTA